MINNSQRPESWPEDQNYNIRFFKNRCKYAFAFYVNINVYLGLYFLCINKYITMYIGLPPVIEIK